MEYEEIQEFAEKVADELGIYGVGKEIHVPVLAQNAELGITYWTRIFEHEKDCTCRVCFVTEFTRLLHRYLGKH